MRFAKYTDPDRAAHRVGIEDVREVWAGGSFPGCTSPPAHVITIDLSQFPELDEEVRAVGTIHLVYAACEACDAWMMEGSGDAPVDFEGEMVFVLQDDGRIRPESPDGYYRSCTKAAPCPPEEGRRGLAFVEDEALRTQRPRITVGGAPRWVQSPEPPESEGDWRYVAQIYAFDLGFGGQHLYVFVEPGTRRIAMKMQCT